MIYPSTGSKAVTAPGNPSRSTLLRAESYSAPAARARAGGNRRTLSKVENENSTDLALSHGHQSCSGGNGSAKGRESDSFKFDEVEDRSTQARSCLGF